MYQMYLYWVGGRFQKQRWAHSLVGESVGEREYYNRNRNFAHKWIISYIQIMFWLACRGKRSKLLFNIIKTIIIAFTNANPGRNERAFQSTENKTLLQRVRLPSDFNCSCKLAQKHTPNGSKIMTLFKVDALSAHPFRQFFPASSFSFSIVLLLASIV